MSNIQKATKLLYSAGYSDLEEIKNVMVDLLQERATESQLGAKQEQEYELKRASLFLEYKKLKVEGKTKMTDREMEMKAKEKSINDYKQTLAYARVLKEYIDMLKSLKIDLMHERKQNENLY